MNEPSFISRPTAEMLHRRSLMEHGGQEGIRDEHALESALAQPRHIFHYGHGDRFDMAAAYAYPLAESQPFLDGNKRAIITTCLLFLERNGASSSSKWSVKLYDALINISSRRLDKIGLADLLRRLAGQEVRD